MRATHARAVRGRSGHPPTSEKPARQLERSRADSRRVGRVSEWHPLSLSLYSREREREIVPACSLVRLRADSHRGGSPEIARDQH